ncbi:MAG: protein kinase domain-containing protein [Vicinamibacterales bacterium]
MTFVPGDRIGRYEVVARAGSGGMGEVYKARDEQLNRFVALKVIAVGLGDRAEFRQRFTGEARAIAALNHPHICSLYDVGHHGDDDYLVLEYLEGETLATRLANGRLPLPELLGVAIEMADALDYAHRRGVIHRDLKPANVLLTRAGGAKLLDFGLAALRGAAAAGADAASGLTTKPVPLTAEGSFVGTLHYLAPERMDGREADARSDIFAFGAILYEMATGKRAFNEPSQARLIAAILAHDPPPIETIPATPPDLQWIVQNCLAKNPDDRWQSVADISRVLRRLARAPTAPAAGAARSRVSGWKWVAAAAIAGAALVAALAMRGLTDRTPGGDAAEDSGGVVTFPVAPPSGGFGLTDSSVKSAQFALSPDGRVLAFVAGEPVARLWLRTLDALEPHALPGTSGASYPFWSPDGRYIGFFAEERLKRIRVPGGPVETICEATNGRGGTWSRDNEIIFSPGTEHPLLRVRAAGASMPAPFLQLAPDQTAGHRWPQFLPDGRRLLFYVRSQDVAVQGIYVAPLDGSAKPRRLRAAATNGLYVKEMLLFVLDGVLMAERLNPESLNPEGEPISLGLPVGTSSSFYSAFSATDNVIATWSGESTSELTWFDRKGKPMGTAVGRGHHIDFRLSPDEQRLAFSRVDPGGNTPDLWVVDLARDAASRVGSSSATDASPVWSPDGRNIVFRSNRAKAHALYSRPASQYGDDQLLYSAAHGMYPTDWSPDRSLILYHSRQPLTGIDIQAYDTVTRSVIPIVRTPLDEAQGQLGPAGLVAYTSDEPDGLNVFIRRQQGGDFVRVSTKGGFDPRWRGDGRELFYIAHDGQMMSAEISHSPLNVIRTSRLFLTSVRPLGSPFSSDYVVSRDGQRFLIKQRLVLPESHPIAITIDWTRKLSGSR